MLSACYSRVANGIVQVASFPMVMGVRLAVRRRRGTAFAAEASREVWWLATGETASSSGFSSNASDYLRRYDVKYLY